MSVRLSEELRTLVDAVGQVKGQLPYGGLRVLMMRRFACGARTSATIDVGGQRLGQSRNP